MKNFKNILIVAGMVLGIACQTKAAATKKSILKKSATKYAVPAKKSQVVPVSQVTTVVNKEIENIKFFIPSKPAGQAIPGKVTLPTEVAWIAYHIDKPKPLPVSCSCLPTTAIISDVVGWITACTAQKNYEDYALAAAVPLLKDIFTQNKCTKITITSQATQYISYADMTSYQSKKPIKPLEAVPFIPHHS